MHRRSQVLALETTSGELALVSSSAIGGREQAVVEQADVFISFSGHRSEAAALALKRLLQAVVPDVVPWTCHDIPRGVSAWPQISTALKGSKFGVLMITQESQSAPWVAFEAGPLMIQAKPVVPYLIDEPEGDQHPWQAFGLNPTRANTTDTLDLVLQVAKVVLGVGNFDSAGVTERFSLLAPAFFDELKPKSGPTCLSEVSSIWRHARLLDGDTSRPFHQWIGARTLKRAGPALKELSDQPDRSKIGATEYVQRVEDLLRTLEPSCVFALCGRKGLESQQDQYFDHFLEKAALAKFSKGVSTRKVCRIFVESSPMVLHPESEPVWNRHLEVANSSPAVLPLRILHARRRELDRTYPGIDRQLEAGFGFLILLGKTKACAVVHEGAGVEMQFSEIYKRLILSELMTFFRFLYRQASAYGPSADVHPDVWRSELDELSGHFHRRIWGVT